MLFHKCETVIADSQDLQLDYRLWKIKGFPTLTGVGHDISNGSVLLKLFIGLRIFFLILRCPPLIVSRLQKVNKQLNIS
jgi:hypothetical protein